MCVETNRSVYWAASHLRHYPVFPFPGVLDSPGIIAGTATPWPFLSITRRFLWHRKLSLVQMCSQALLVLLPGLEAPTESQLFCPFKSGSYLKFVN